jgi:hypothetical protein
MAKTLPIAGSYIIYCGDHFYLGSSCNIAARRSDHRLRLRRKEHHNEELQRAFDSTGRFEFQILQTLVYDPEIHTDLRGFTLAVRALEQVELDKRFNEDLCCNTSITAIGATNPRPDLAAKWENPEFRARMLELAKRIPGEETRRKMSEAKRGGRNYCARAVWTELRGERFGFPSTSDAARHFGVKQQVMHGWMSGLFLWPGSPGSREVRRTAHLRGLIGGYVEEKSVRAEERARKVVDSGDDFGGLS